MTVSRTRWSVVSWAEAGVDDRGQARVVYQGPLEGSGLRLHYGFDGWQEPRGEVRLEEAAQGVTVSEPVKVEGHLTLECVVTDGRQWDNNQNADYRLWIGSQPVDAHLHVSGRGRGELGVWSLATAMVSAGMGSGIVSWIDNAALDRLGWEALPLYPLVWVRPGETSVEEVRERLARGYVGVKLHPTVDDYRADDVALDPYLEVVAAVGCPVACHSAPGEADPDHIRRLAERFPAVPIIFYHTYLGPREGRQRAVQHAREQGNVYLETSWCRGEEVVRLVEEVGAERILFGSDASVDGPHHYCRQPPNVEGQETYNAGLVEVVRAIGPQAARQILGDNTRRLFGIR